MMRVSFIANRYPVTGSQAEAVGTRGNFYGGISLLSFSIGFLLLATIPTTDPDKIVRAYDLVWLLRRTAGKRKVSAFA